MMNLQLAIGLCTLIGTGISPAPVSLQLHLDCVAGVKACIDKKDADERAAQEKEQKSFYADDTGCIKFQRRSAPVAVSSSSVTVSVSETVTRCGYRRGEKVYVPEADGSTVWGTLIIGSGYPSQYLPDEELHQKCFKDWAKKEGYL